MDADLVFVSRTELERARAGELDGFEAVYRLYAPVVLAFLSRRGARPEVAADLFAETFTGLFLLVVHDVERPVPDAPLAWLISTARNRLIDGYRRGKVEAAARQRLEVEPRFSKTATYARSRSSQQKQIS
jgi:DNA-directed RNA polymerase specialized sigma24 family protein